MTYQQAMAQARRQYVALVLKRTGGNVTEAARLASMSRQHLHRLIAKERIEGAVIGDLAFAGDLPTFDEHMRAAARQYLSAALDQSGNNVTHAAATAGIKRRYFYERLHTHDLAHRLTRNRAHRGNWAQFGL